MSAIFLGKIATEAQGIDAKQDVVQFIPQGNA
jgi:hypothetical protein